MSSSFNLATLKSFTKPKISYDNLRKFNMAAAVLYALQAVAIVIFADSSRGAQPITTNYLTNDSLASSGNGHQVLVQATHHLFDLKLVYPVVAFLLASAVVRWLAANQLRRQYEAGLRKAVNKFRWIEHGITASLMVVTIALLAGVYDLALLLLLIGLTSLVGMFGYLMETNKRALKTTRGFDYILSVKTGAWVWMVVLIYLLGALIYGSGLPTYVYFIFGSLFAVFSGFSINTYLSQVQHGRWASYNFGERIYILLSLVGTAALAWQVFAGALR